MCSNDDDGDGDDDGDDDEEHLCSTLIDIGCSEMHHTENLRKHIMITNHSVTSM